MCRRARERKRRREVEEAWAAKVVSGLVSACCCQAWIDLIIHLSLLVDALTLAMTGYSQWHQVSYYSAKPTTTKLISVCKPAPGRKKREGKCLSLFLFHSCIYGLAYYVTAASNLGPELGRTAQTLYKSTTRTLGPRSWQKGPTLTMILRSPGEIYQVPYPSPQFKLHFDCA